MNIPVILETNISELIENMLEYQSGMNVQAPCP